MGLFNNLLDSNNQACSKAATQEYTMKCAIPRGVFGVLLVFLMLFASACGFESQDPNGSDGGVSFGDWNFGDEEQPADDNCGLTGPTTVAFEPTIVGNTRRQGITLVYTCVGENVDLVVDNQVTGDLTVNATGFNMATGTYGVDVIFLPLSVQEAAGYVVFTAADAQISVWVSGEGIAADADGDGHTDVNHGGDDCDDQNGANFPGNTEVCDQQDNNCNGQIDEGVCDGDGDGVTPEDGDCDDTNPAIHPGAAEICDTIDNDCDGVVDNGNVCDLDGDGHLSDVIPGGDDCDDTEQLTYLGAPELCDGRDNDCDTAIDNGGVCDLDGDGVSPANGDCDDTDHLTYPGAAELCDGFDNDCDGVVPADEADGDGDNWLVCENDCDDTEIAINPGAVEVLDDNIDQDCDSLDEVCIHWSTSVGIENALASPFCDSLDVGLDNHGCWWYGGLRWSVEAGMSEIIQLDGDERLDGEPANKWCLPVDDVNSLVPISLNTTIVEDLGDGPNEYDADGDGIFETELSCWVANQQWPHYMVVIVPEDECITELRPLVP